MVRVPRKQFFYVNRRKGYVHDVNSFFKNYLIIVNSIKKIDTFLLNH